MGYGKSKVAAEAAVVAGGSGGGINEKGRGGADRGGLLCGGSYGGSCRRRI